MDRRSVALVGGLAVVSSAVLLGSVVSALASFDEQDVVYSAVAVPRGLLSPEPVNAATHMPPTAELTAEIGLAAVPVPASPTSSQPGGRPVTETPKPTLAPQVVVKQPRFEIEMVSSAKGRGGSRTLSYEVTIKNVGEIAVPGLAVRSHVPLGTSWRPSPSCGGKGHEVTVSYPSGKERLCIAGDGVVVGDSSSHPVDITLNAFDPGTSVTVSFVVDVDSGYQDVIQNHSHLFGTGVDLVSGSTSDSTAGSQSSAE